MIKDMNKPFYYVNLDTNNIEELAKALRYLGIYCIKDPSTLNHGGYCGIVLSKKPIDVIELTDDIGNQDDPESLMNLVNDFEPYPPLFEVGDKVSPVGVYKKGTVPVYKIVNSTYKIENNSWYYEVVNTQDTNDTANMRESYLTDEFV